MNVSARCCGDSKNPAVSKMELSHGFTSSEEDKGKNYSSNYLMTIMMSAGEGKAETGT